MPNQVSPEIAQAMSSGRSTIGAQIGAANRGIEDWMGTYGIQAPAYAAQLSDRLGIAGAEATRDMDTGLKLAQLRKDLHDKRLALLWKQLEQQRKDQRMNVYATALGAAGAIGGSAMNMGNQWRSTVPKAAPAAAPAVPTMDYNEYLKRLNPFGMFEVGTL